MAYYLCVLDFEATCWPDKRDDTIREIIEFPSLLFKIDYKNNIQPIAEFHKYVKPTINPILSNFCTELTGITQKTVDDADVFEKVYQQHYEWIQSHVPTKDKLIFVTCGKWDLRDMLPLEVNRYNLKLHHRYKKYTDLKEDFINHYKRGSGTGGMISMLKKLNIEPEGSNHSGIDDCQNISKIVIKMIETGYKFT